MDNTREKLIELLCKVQDYGTKNTCEEWSVTVECKDNDEIADYLIANGVTINRGTDDTSVAYNLSPTNADRIRAMSDEQLAGLLAHEVYRIGQPVFEYLGYGITEEVVYVKRLKWLKQPVGDDDG